MDDLENAREVLSAYDELVDSLRAENARLREALTDCKRYAEDHDDEWVPHRVDDALSEGV